MTTLTSPRMEVDLDIHRMSQDALRDGWGDGLPIVPPTESMVEEFISASGMEADHSLGVLPPLHAPCTIERVAINAVMAGGIAEAMPLICAALSAMIDPAFELPAINATTASVVPAVIVNGAIRDRLDIPYSYSVLGGAASPAPTIGRAIRLVMRNVAGQVSGRTSESIFGQPGRVVGIVAAEWEERSPWPSLAERRGVSGDAVTVFGTLGTCNVLDSVAASGREVLEVIGRSLAFMGNSNFHYVSTYAEQMIAINPIWARDIIARDIPSLEDVQQIIWESAYLPIDWFPEALRPSIEERGRIDEQGRVRLMEAPDELHVIVCGGLGNLHAAMLPGFSHTEAVTRAVV